jgi:hypothetical protein
MGEEVHHAFGDRAQLRGEGRHGGGEVVEAPGANALGDRREELVGLVRHVFAHEQVREVRVPAVAVEVQELDARDLEPGLAQDMKLHGDVGDVRRLHVERGLHFNEREATGLSLEDIHGHKYAALEKARFVDDVGATGESSSGGIYTALDVILGRVDEDTAREAFSSSCAHSVTALEHRLEFVRAGVDLPKCERWFGQSTAQ